MTLLEGVTLPDSARFTPEGRRLLVSLGVVEAEPLRVATEEWLAGHKGPETPAVRRARRALGDVPADWIEAAKLFRDVEKREGRR